MGRTALLVIDAQRAFYDGDAIPAVYDGEQVLARISGVLERARVAGLPIVYIQHAGGSGHSLEEGGKGWQVHHEVQPQKSDVIVAKTIPDSFYGTSLKAELDGLGAKDLVVVGNQTDFCIDTTCRRARSLDYCTTLLRDAHSTWDNEYLKARQITDHHNLVLGRQFVSIGESVSFDFDQLS